MQLSVTALDGDLVHVTLTGRMDTLGADKIALPFTAAVAARMALVAVDLEQVDFLASAGLRQFFAGARAQKQRGGHVVLVAPQPDVRSVLMATGVPAIIPVYDTLPEALAALRDHAAH
ncbi:MAG: STAS domain-containing protein [Pseudomonadota bacterium]|jgi:anti-anti-sigma factor